MQPSPAPDATAPGAPSLLYRRFMPFGRLAVRLFARSFAPRLKMTGLQHIPYRGAVILAPSHISNSDPVFVLHGTQRPLWFMAKQELFEMPSIAWLIRFLQAFPVEQQGADRVALQRAEELLEHGQALVMFPEGKCATDDQLGPILPGASLLALRTGVPIIPVGIWGTNHVMPYAAVIPRPTLHPVRLHYGPPLQFHDIVALPRRDQRAAVSERLETALRAAVAVARQG